MKVTVVTPCLNRVDVIEACIRSVIDQTHRDVEHVIVDGGSTDGTLDVLERYDRRIAHWSTGPDRGIYDAINRGIAAATGEAVGVLNADDVYADARALETVARALEKTGAESCYGDLVYVHAKDPERVVRYWVSGRYRRSRFRSRGWMPPHPAFFVRREVHGRYGVYNTDLGISSDYEMMLRLLVRHGISTHYVPRVLVRMRSGGVSGGGPASLLRAAVEDYRAWRLSRLPPSLFTIAMKKLGKLPQFFRRYAAPA
ncbi:MAG: glycosyltransferase family 2 protein [Planctomycetota bacterium]